MVAARRRLDRELVRRRFASSRTAAQALVAAGRVRVGGAVAHKSARMVAASESLHVVGDAPRFVSRGGYKLEAALDSFGIDVAGRRALDVGASTGGFTDCLLQRGSSEVVAVDVGRGQLDARLRLDPRVSLRERCNVRHLRLADLATAADVVTADLSFISLRTVMANLAECAAVGADVVLLIKPQFEAGRREASRGRGVVTDPTVWRRTLVEVAVSARSHGLEPRGLDVSCLRGAAGNVEFFLHCRRFDRARTPTGAISAEEPSSGSANTDGLDVTGAAGEAVRRAQAMPGAKGGPAGAWVDPRGRRR